MDRETDNGLSDIDRDMARRHKRANKYLNMDVAKLRSESSSDASDQEVNMDYEDQSQKKSPPVI